MGRFIMGWSLISLPGILWAGPVWASLGSMGPGLMGFPGPLWAGPLLAQPFLAGGLGRALMAPWAILNVLPGAAGPNQLMFHPHMHIFGKKLIS